MRVKKTTPYARLTLTRYAQRNGNLFSFASGSFEADGINELFEIV
jgi:hypothetical protein